MKKYFINTIFILLMVSLVSLLSGVCVFQFSTTVLAQNDLSQTMGIESDEVNPTITPRSDDCGGISLTETVVVDLTQQSETNHHPDTMATCCIGSSHEAMARLLQSGESSRFFPVFLLAKEQLVIQDLSVSSISDRVIPQLTLLSTQTTVLRL